jgi:hypothetical protein
MANKWLAHVKKTMKSHKGMKFGQVLKLAKKTYKGGGGVEAHSDFGAGADLSYVGANNGSQSLRTGDAGALGGRRRRSRRRCCCRCLCRSL